MRHNLINKCILLTGLALASSSIVSAQYKDPPFFQHGKVYLTIHGEESDREAWVTFPSITEHYQGDIIIPETAKNVKYDYTVTGIDRQAFGYCDNLRIVEVPNTVSFIAASAFKGSNIDVLKLGNSITGIGDAFLWTTINKLKITDLSKWCKIIFTSEFSNPIKVSATVYLNDTRLTRLVIPDDVTAIPDYAFFGFKELQSVVLPPSVKSIKTSAFSDCISLNSIEISSSVESIYARAFWNCTGLKSIDIPNTVNSLGARAFGCCRSLKSAKIGNSIKTIKESSFCCCEDLVSLHLGDGISGIESDAFAGCSSLINVCLPDLISSIGENAFYQCENMTNINIPQPVKNIGTNALSKCNKISVLRFNAIDAKKSSKAFEDCTIKSFVIGKDVKSINRYMLRGANIESIIALGTIPPDCSGAFPQNIPETVKLYVPHEAYDLYREHEIWGTFSNILSITPINNLQFTQDQLNINPKDTFSLKDLLNKEQSNASVSQLEWISSDYETVTVDGEGNIEALKHGEAKITAKSIDGSGLEASCVIKVGGFDEGDINGDGNVNIGDVTALINHILGNTPANFIAELADINGDNKVNIGDVTALINKILTSNN